MISWENVQDIIIDEVRDCLILWCIVNYFAKFSWARHDRSNIKLWNFVLFSVNHSSTEYLHLIYTAYMSENYCIWIEIFFQHYTICLKLSFSPKLDFCLSVIGWEGPTLISKNWLKYAEGKRNQKQDIVICIFLFLF